MGVRGFAKELLPPVVIEAINHILRRPRFVGNFGSFEEALSRSKGYNSREIAAAFSRQQVTKDDRITPTAQQILAALAPIASGKNHLSVLDVGGANGYYYHVLKRFLPPVQWIILETPEMARACANGSIRYVSDTSDLAPPFDVVILSGVLQYFPDPYETLKRFCAMAPFTIINRTPLIEGDRLTVQIVHTQHYRTSYPAWFLSEKKVIGALGAILMRWDAEDAPVFRGRRIRHQGMLARNHQFT